MPSLRLDQTTLKLQMINAEKPQPRSSGAAQAAPWLTPRDTGRLAPLFARAICRANGRKSKGVRENTAKLLGPCVNNSWRLRSPDAHPHVAGTSSRSHVE
ncbi:hypothetical protein ETAA8_16520 [Anatilimnocola aggregata]|uniref:Uncharacterized protein n=1 Tax=Anatilimnocola aggregata TaxID=2528021 RepID=A0A517Y8V1_9BACT|nr:hypothetical protein ETAA8_16520 [Anatilimnocola aggregata]